MTKTKTQACPTEQAIVDYVNGRLTETERFQLENHLLDCPLCAKTVESLEQHGLPEQGELELMVSKNIALINNPETPQKANNPATQVGSLKSVSTGTYPFIRPILAVAAAVLLLLGLYVWYRSATADQQLFAEYFEPLPRYGYVSVRSLSADPETDLLAAALRAQSAGDYTLSIASWNAYLESEIDNADYRPHLYLALAQMQIGRLEEATENLNQLPPGMGTEIGEEAEWYRALLDLRLERREKAKKRLQQLIKKGRTVYAERANSLMEDLR